MDFRSPLSSSILAHPITLNQKKKKNMAYSEFHIDRSDTRSPKSQMLLDEDGAFSYETDYGSLLLQIIRRNDIPKLHQYISTYSPKAILAPREAYY